MEEFLLKLLDEKEERARTQSNLISKYKKPLISFGLNIPGQEKNSNEIKQFFLKVLERLKNKLEENKINIIFEKINSSEVGNIAFLVLDKNEAEKIKKILIAFEEEKKYGRILDLDLFGANNKLLSRQDLGYTPRKCLLCDKEAIFCIKNRSHSFEELNQKAMDIIRRREIWF